MALTTTYIIVPFLAGAGGALHPGSPRRTLVRSTAVAMADELAPAYAGVAVLRDRSDAEADVFLEPLLVCAMGAVPGHISQLAA